MEIKEIISSGLLELYATGLASPEEAAQVLRWADQFPEVAAELASINAGLDRYFDEQAIQPNASVKEKIFEQINATESAKVVRFETHTADGPAKVIPIFSFWKRVAVASVVLLVVSSAINFYLYQKNDQTDKALQESREWLGKLEDSSKTMANDLHVIQSKYSMPVALNKMDNAPDAAAKVFWMKNTGEVYLDPTNLPATPTGMQYHLWAIVDNKPVDAGIVLTDKHGNNFRIQKMKAFGKVEAFAVSLEKGGDKLMDAPKGQIMVMGKM